MIGRGGKSHLRGRAEAYSHEMKQKEYLLGPRQEVIFQGFLAKAIHDKILKTHNFKGHVLDESINWLSCLEDSSKPLLYGWSETEENRKDRQMQAEVILSP